MDRDPNFLMLPVMEPPTAVLAAVDAFARRLDPGDPLRVAFDCTIVPMVVSDPTLPDNPLVYVNEAFTKLTGFTADDVLGRNCRFMQGPLTELADVVRLRDAIRRRERIDIDLLNHRRDGTPFWNRLMVAPVFASDGEVRYFVASQVDVTLERHRLIRLQEDRATLTAEVADREARLDLALRAGGLGTWSFDPTTQELTASSSCKAIFGRPADAPFTYADFMKLIHPDDLQRVEDAAKESFERGGGYDIDYRILTAAGEQRWVSVQGEMQYRADGSPLALIGFSTDISARKFAEEHRAVLARELTHRVKNTLATVGAVVSQTLRDASSLAEARAAVAGRITSLGTAHELLVEEEVEGAPIGDIVARVLAPFIDTGSKRWTIAGPLVRLSPEMTLALSMALYELATNAVKYGALSTPEGRVEICWRLLDRDGPRRFSFSWIETGGPPVAPPGRTGFGTRMIERVLGPHLVARAGIAYPVEGVRFEIEAAV